MTQFDTINLLKQIANDANHKYNSIANYTLQNIEKIYFKSINDFANSTYISIATVHRFIKYLNLSSYKEFKYILKQIAESKNGIDGIIKTNDDIIVNKVYSSLINTVNETNELLHKQNDKIIKIANKLIQSYRIILVAFGGTYNIARDLYNKLQRIGLLVNISNDINNLFYLIKLLNENDILFVISYSGITKEITRIIDLLNFESKSKPYIISITKNIANPLASISNINLFVNSDESINRLTSWSSRSALLFAIDAIYLTLINQDKNKYTDILKLTAIEK